MHQKQSSLLFVTNLELIHKTDLKFKIENCCFRKSESIKYLGVPIDSDLTYQDDVKSILRKMACGIKPYIHYER